MCCIKQLFAASVPTGDLHRPGKWGASLLRASFELFYTEKRKKIPRGLVVKHTKPYPTLLNMPAIFLRFISFL